MLKMCLCILLLILSLDITLSISGIIIDKTVVCYVGTYASTREGRGTYTLDNVDPSLCTHVIFGFAHLKNDTSVYVLDSWNTFMGNSGNLAMLKQKYPDVKFLAAIGGWLDGTRIFSIIARDEHLRISFAENVIKFLRNNGLDGADLCWLYPSKRSGFLSDRQNFVEMLKELKKQLHAQNFLLTAMLGTSYDTVDNGYDLKSISENIDLMNIISYDYNGFWSENIQPNSPMNSSDKWNVIYSIRHMLKSGASPEKLVLGIPLYGRVFIATNETTASGRPVTFGDDFEKEGERRNSFLGPYTQDESGIIAYGEICLELLEQKKWTRYWDDKSSTPYIVHEDKLISYDDAESTAIKVQYAIEQNLAGVMVFSLDLDNFMGDCYSGEEHINNYHMYPLLTTIKDQLRRYYKEIPMTTKSTIDSNEINYTSSFVSSSVSRSDVCAGIMFLIVLVPYGIE